MVGSSGASVVDELVVVVSEPIEVEVVCCWFTVMVTVAVTVCPAPLSTVSVYVVVTVGLMSMARALGNVPIPLSTVAIEPDQ